jgi:hypothetical protein
MSSAPDGPLVPPEEFAGVAVNADAKVVESTNPEPRAKDMLSTANTIPIPSDDTTSLEHAGATQAVATAKAEALELREARALNDAARGFDNRRPRAREAALTESDYVPDWSPQEGAVTA